GRGGRSRREPGTDPRAGRGAGRGRVHWSAAERRDPRVRRARSVSVRAGVDAGRDRDRAGPRADAGLVSAGRRSAARPRRARSGGPLRHRCAAARGPPSRAATARGSGVGWSAARGRWRGRAGRGRGPAQRRQLGVDPQRRAAGWRSRGCRRGDGLAARPRARRARRRAPPLSDGSSDGGDRLAKIVGWSVRHRAAVLATWFALAIVGLIVARRLELDALPDVTGNQVVVLTRAPGLTPSEIERSVTRPIEVALGGLPGLIEQRSLSRYGISSVVAVFGDDVDPWLARQQVGERIATVGEL